jgi:carbohydrate kinase (thermoresistant glucokinase family)
MAFFFVVMGVSGSGKSTLAGRLAHLLGAAPMIEADALHPVENRAKMAAGTPLTDDDRWPWLARVNQEMVACQSPVGVVACSALRAVYRERLRQGLAGRVHFIFLDAPRGVLEQHVRDRRHEYMPASLLESQLATLERPGAAESASTVSVAGSEDESFAAICAVVWPLLPEEIVKCLQPIGG